MAAAALEQSVLESKDKDTLLEMAKALGVKANSRLKKSDIIDKILDTTGPSSEPAPRPAPVKEPDVAAEPKVTTVTKPEVKTVSTAETLTAFAYRPIASWSPGSEIEIYQDGLFSVAVNNRIANGQLFGEPAKIRFTATSSSWQFSDGVDFAGSTLARSFADAGEYSATATVTYRVDYQMS